MFAEQLRCGSLVDGKRVVGMRTGVTNQRRYVRVKFLDGSWSGPLWVGARVAGTVARTDIPSGPVGAGRGHRASRVGWREGESRRDRHARMVDAIVYGG